MSKTRPTDLPDDLDVWVMAGQSNMEGCGALAESLQPDPRVWCFTTRHEWRMAKDPLHDLLGSRAPVDRALRLAATPPAEQKPEKKFRDHWHRRNQGKGAGLGIAFGSAFSAVSGRPVGLVACAHGGTTLDQWDHRRRDERLDSLYGAMLARIRQAGGNLRGLLWYQGESEAMTDSAATYRRRFVAWVRALRKDLNRPDLPVVTVQLGGVAFPESNAASWANMRQVQLEMPRFIDHLGVVTAIDLDLEDAIHLDAPGLIRLGRRMARVALRLSGVDRRIPAGPRFASLSAGGEQEGLGEVEINFTGVAGSLLPCRGIKGFSILRADLKPHPTIAVCRARRHPRKKNAVIVKTTRPPAPGNVMAYGHGLMPIGNLVDEADMAVPAFGAKIRSGDVARRKRP
jgi:sialate O-acetylesterase